MFTDHDQQFMQIALDWSMNGLGVVSPNPPVGCVIVNNGEIIGRGFHRCCGGAHAEIDALNHARANNFSTVGATVYVTLMPCHHHGKTPPCTAALLTAQIARVVVAIDDPNPQSGDGAKFLRDNNINVEVGCLAEPARKIMAGFLKFHHCQMPHLLLKYAMTLDGKIAPSDGNSRWISNEASREYVQVLRQQTDAIMIGVNTAIIDQPRLNVRDENQHQPRRVIIDSKLRLNAEMPLFTHHGGDFIIMHVGDSPNIDALRKLPKVKLCQCNADNEQRVDLKNALTILARDYSVRTILCEGGAQLNANLLQQQLVDEAAIFIAPKFLGGSGITPTEAEKSFPLTNAPQLTNIEYKNFADDLLMRGQIVYQ